MNYDYTQAQPAQSQASGGSAPMGGARNYQRAGAIQNKMANGTPNIKRGRSWEQLQNRHTRVLFVRNVAEVTPDIHLANLCQRYGPVTQILQMVEKRSAFVEFEVFEDAERCIIDFRAQPPNLDGRYLQFAYSGRDKIKMPDIPFPKNNPPSKVLNLKISNVKYQITIDVCKKLMGEALEKVSIREPLNGEGCVNVLAQFMDLPSADKARETLDGKYIYTGCNRIAATYSHLQSVEIPTDGPFMHDFTRLAPAPPAVDAFKEKEVAVVGLLGGDPNDPAAESFRPDYSRQNSMRSYSRQNSTPTPRTPGSIHSHYTPHSHGHVSPAHSAAGALHNAPALPPLREVTECINGEMVTRTIVDTAAASPPSMSQTSSHRTAFSRQNSTPKPWDAPETTTYMPSPKTETPGQRVDNLSQTPPRDLNSKETIGNGLEQIPICTPEKHTVGLNIDASDNTVQ